MRILVTLAIACALLAVRCGSDGSSAGADVPGDSRGDAEVADVRVDTGDETDAPAADVADALEAPPEGADATEIADVPADVPHETVTPTCLAPQLPSSCLSEALACTGLPDCGPTVTGCFQYGSSEFPQATWLISDDFTAFALGTSTYAAANDTLRIDFSNGARMESEFLPRPRALYYSPEGELCAHLDFHYDENSGNWGSSDVARHYYLRYGDGKLVTIRPRFEASPAVWWRLDGFDVSCADGTTESWSFEQFKPFAYLLFGGESRDGTSFLPYWTADGCELGEFRKECLNQEDLVERSSCDGTTLQVCNRGVALNVDCAAKGKGCAQVPVGWGDVIYYYHAFCWDGESCSGDFCDGDEVGMCWGYAAERKDCGAIGATCVIPAFGVSPAPAMCAQKPAAFCDEAAFPSSCDGDTVVQCAYYGYEYRQDCARLGMRCVVGTGWDDEPYATCVPSAATEPCGADYVAACDGDLRRVCLNEAVVVEEDCRARWGKTCKEGSAGVGCVDADATVCTNTDNNCAGCDGDRAMACGQGGLTVFDDCAVQGLAAGAGRTCYAGTDTCGVCGQPGAETCDAETFTPACSDQLIVNCYAGHQLAWDCAEGWARTSGWCNLDAQGSAYCESMAVLPCDPATTPSTCEEAPPVAVNCTSSHVVQTLDCFQAGMEECRLNAEARAVCVQSGAVACDAVAFVQACDVDATVVCSNGFTLATPCSAGWECGLNAEGNAVCHQAGAEPCDWWQFDYRCEGQTAVSCESGYVMEVDCPPACAMCSCHSDAMQAWCQPDF